MAPPILPTLKVGLIQSSPVSEPRFPLSHNGWEAEERKVRPGALLKSLWL